jgi:hypothetical protein
VTLTISSTHAARDKAREAYRRIAGFLAALRKNAEQLNSLQRWYRNLSEALRHFLKGRQLQAPIRLQLRLITYLRLYRAASVDLMNDPTAGFRA